METKERQYRPGERVPGTEYVVVRLEAEGGHGALYLVRHHFLEKKVQMLKTLRSFSPSRDLVERLKREAQMLAAMDHPHIVSVTSGGLTDEKDPKPYFVMERLKGRSLAQIMPDAPEGVGIDAALKVCIEVCDALDYVHVRHGVVHRDIKPDNIFLHVTPRNGSITKILDFGVAHIMDLNERYTKNNVFLGTPRYASPEQIMGDVPSARTDLYAVGLLLYELVLGYGPFESARNFATMTTAHVHEAPPGFPKNRRFPRGLEALVMSMLAKSPSDRPASAEKVASQLRAIKREADAEEQARTEELNQTDMSPIQNVLTGYRGAATAAPLVSVVGAALSSEAPATERGEPLALGPTMAAEGLDEGRTSDAAPATESYSAVAMPVVPRAGTEPISSRGSSIAEPPGEAAIAPTQQRTDPAQRPARGDSLDIATPRRSGNPRWLAWGVAGTVSAGIVVAAIATYASYDGASAARAAAAALASTPVAPSEPAPTEPTPPSVAPQSTTTPSAFATSPPPASAAPKAPPPPPPPPAVTAEPPPPAAPTTLPSPPRRPAPALTTHLPGAGL